MPREDLRNRISSIEEAYEFMLSYAARGLQTDGGSPLRSHLEKTAAALEEMADVARAASKQPDEAGATADVEPFLPVLGHDAAASKAAVDMVLAQEAISSQLIDNLNASIHLRALLTDLFLIDEVLGLGVGDNSPPAQFAPDEEEQFGPD